MSDTPIQHFTLDADQCSGEMQTIQCSECSDFDFWLTIASAAIGRNGEIERRNREWSGERLSNTRSPRRE
jgi:hypothetical protein